MRERHVAADVHGETGLDGPDLPPASRDPLSVHAIDWIAGALASSPEPVTIVATGPLTNIALLLARYPQAGSQIERLVIMGGSVGEGNVTPAAEFNIWADPEAAARVFTAGLDLTMVGLDVTHQALMTPAHVAQLAQAGTAGRLVADLFGFYARFHRERYGWDGRARTRRGGIGARDRPDAAGDRAARGRRRHRARALARAHPRRSHRARGMATQLPRRAAHRLRALPLDLVVARISALG